MDAAAGAFGKSESTARRLANAVTNLSDSRFWAYYLLIPSLRFDFRRRALSDHLGHRVELSRNEAQSPRPWHGLRRTEALRGDDRGPGVLVVLAQYNRLDHRRGHRGGHLGHGSGAPAQSRSARLPYGLRPHPLPWFLPNVVAGHMWALMLDPRLGVINDMLVKIGVLSTYKAWFADPDTALASALMVEIWHGFPFFALLFLAGLKAIPKDLYEAAAIDGVGPFQRFRYRHASATQYDTRRGGRIARHQPRQLAGHHSHPDWRRPRAFHARPVALRLPESATRSTISEPAAPSPSCSSFS